MNAVIRDEGVGFAELEMWSNGFEFIIACPKPYLAPTETVIPSPSLKTARLSSSKPTVAHVTPWYLPHLGGLERHVEAISTGINSFNFVILTPRIPGTPSVERPSESLTIRRLEPMKFQAMTDPRAFPALRDWVTRLARVARLRRGLKEIDFDILHVHRPPIIELAYLAGKWRNMDLLRRLSQRLNRLRVGDKPRVTTDHSLFLWPSTGLQLELTWFMEFVLEEFDHVICVDRLGFERASSLRDADPSRYPNVKIHHIPQPIDTRLFRWAPLPDSNELIVGYSGRWERDGMYLLRALAEKELPGVRFLISGGATERDIAEYRMAFSRPGVTLRPNVVSLKELSEFYRSIHVLVDLARGDGCGRSVLEAMASGRPVVRLRAHDTRPVIDGETGILVEPEVRAISQELKSLAGRREWLAEMGQRARAAIEREYHRDLSLGRIERVYRECLSGS